MNGGRVTQELAIVSEDAPVEEDGRQDLVLDDISLLWASGSYQVKQMTE